MKVNHTGNSPVQGTETSQTNRAGKAGAAGRAKGGDKAAAANEARSSEAVKTELSARGREMAAAKAIASDAPDVREEKIAELKKRIAEGKYNVHPDALADKLVNEHLNMSGIG